MVDSPPRKKICVDHQQDELDIKNNVLQTDNGITYIFNPEDENQCFVIKNEDDFKNTLNNEENNISNSLEHENQHVPTEMTQQTMTANPPAQDSIAEGITRHMKQIRFDEHNMFFGPPAATTPIEYFDFFFPEDFLADICQNTNYYVQCLLSKEGSAADISFKSWKELDIDELKKFLGVLFHMGTISLSCIDEYWKKDRLYNICIFASQISKIRFQAIMKHLRFTSNSSGNTSSEQVDKVVEYFNDKMAQCYIPGRDLALDECLVVWNRHLTPRRTIKNYSFINTTNLFLLTEPDGITVKLAVNCNNKRKKNAVRVNTPKMVEKLIEDKLDKGHAIYMESCYNPYKLAKGLLARNTHCTGLLPKKFGHIFKAAGVSHEVLQACLKNGEFASLFEDGVHIGAWRKRFRNEAYVTTQHEPRIVIPQGQTVGKPEAVVEYNKIMSIDRQSLMLAYYPCERINLRSDVKVTIFILHLLLFNAHMLFNKYSGEAFISQNDFRLAIIGKLMTAEDVKDVITVGAVHQLTRIQDKDIRGKTRRKNCRHCHITKKKRKDSVWYCPGCPRGVGLCVECFEDYHKKQSIIIP